MSHISKSRGINTKSRKEIGVLGEKVAATYLQRQGLKVVAQNYTRKTGEIDLIAKERNTLHFVEVKTIIVNEFPRESDVDDQYDPSINIHELKLKKIARTGEWYVLENNWEGEWQVDGCLVWLRRRDGMAHVQYLPQLV